MKTVLIVEDTEDFAANLKFFLSREGYNVVVARDGKEGFEKAVAIKPDLILMDVFMPEQDGAETTIKIKEQASLKDVPIVFLTALTDGEDMTVLVKGRKFPAMSKMMDHQQMLAVIRGYMVKRSL